MQVISKVTVLQLSDTELQPLVYIHSSISYCRLKNRNNIMLANQHDHLIHIIHNPNIYFYLTDLTPILNIHNGLDP